MADSAGPLDESVFSGANAGYMEQLYESYVLDAASVSPAARQLFASLDNVAAPAGAAAAGGVGADTARQLAVSRLIEAYRTLGCRSAAVDPLQIDERSTHPALELGSHGLADADLGTTFSTDIPGLPQAPLKQIVAELRKTYCGHISAEFMHISDLGERQWFIDNYEACRAAPGLDAAEREQLLERLVAADALENYLNTRFTGQKRFSLEGGDALVPMMDLLARMALDKDVKEMCIGMAHRGRLNLLVNLLGKSPQQLFEEFEGTSYQVSYGSGDVKYHMGYSSNLHTEGRSMHMALAFNPSHLEIVNPVVEGSVWARQARRHDEQRDQVIAVLIHGDAALAGQGVNMETLNMSQTRGYTTGGTIHVTVNNQVGFTTSDIQDARSTYWCTDLAKMAEVPVLHVNGNDPEACALAMTLAFNYRMRFHKDIFIDLICYRRNGHNEQDDPKVTQPYMYTRVSSLTNPAKFYADRLVAEGRLDAERESQLRDEYVARLQKGESANPLVVPTDKSEFVDWTSFEPDKSVWDARIDTTIKKQDLARLGERLSTVPDGFTMHSRVNKIIDDRAAMGKGELPIDWGMAENLAYASLVDEGYRVRISGQDVGRGTFFHRHAVWHDQKRSQRQGASYIPLANIRDGQPSVAVVDSLLSEAAVLAFEYGVTLTSPDVLTVWEAQFGDFANSAQVVIDQFISSGEFKWGRFSGLVMLLPHGYEGQGPEHSSARLERYMQLCAEYNMQVCMPSTAAQIFHLLRRQMLRPQRRPLIVLTPKSLLRNKEVASTIADLCENTFQPLIPETDDKIKPGSVKKVLVCSGKIYYELRAARAERKIKDIAIIRIEQFYPFPHEMFKEQIKRYAKASTVVWCQEEPGNQGAWHRIQHYLRRHLASKQELRYALRRSSASTAAGRASLHKQQQQEIIDAALKQ